MCELYEIVSFCFWVQYTARFNAEAVKNFLYSLNDGKIAKKKFNSQFLFSWILIISNLLISSRLLRLCMSKCLHLELIMFFPFFGVKFWRVHYVICTTMENSYCQLGSKLAMWVRRRCHVMTSNGNIASLWWMLWTMTIFNVILG